jgi:hypothetical protein
LDEDKMAGLITIAAALALAVVVTTMSVQSVFATSGTCNNCVLAHAPGQIAINSGGETDANQVIVSLVGIVALALIMNSCQKQNVNLVKTS